jgi:hypothetical protein
LDSISPPRRHLARTTVSRKTETPSSPRQLHQTQVTNRICLVIPVVRSQNFCCTAFRLPSSSRKKKKSFEHDQPTFEILLTCNCLANERTTTIATTIFLFQRDTQKSQHKSKLSLLSLHPKMPTVAPDHTTGMVPSSRSHHNNDKLLHRQHSAYRFNRWQPRLTFFWTCHFLISLLVIFWGGIDNQDTKYIPINVDALKNDALMNYDCSKGFVNVFASSRDDPEALVCCGNGSTKRGGALEEGICRPPHWLFFVSRRLARFPEAWLLPLFPLFVRLLFQMMMQKQQSQSATNNVSNSNNNTITQYRLARRRFYLYIGIIQFRGWILYLLFDQLEEWMVASSVAKDCWYEQLLHDNYHSCQGQGTDFSDHIVLYFAQILPIALVEVLHSFVDEPRYWNDNNNNNNNNNNSINKPTTSFWRSLPIPSILISGMLYLYIVTLMGAYKTAVYFHTWPEILNGYFVSLLVQVPLFLMQCTTMFDSTREYFFGFAI